MKLSLTVIVFLVLLVVGSCKKDDSNPVETKVPPLQIVPQKLGNSWTFVSTSYDTLGSVTGNSEYTDTVLRDTTAWGGHTAHL